MRTVKNHRGQKIEITPGTFVYSGFGMGYLVVSKNQEDDIWCSALDVDSHCERLDLRCRFVDPLVGYSGTYLGD